MWFARPVRSSVTRVVAAGTAAPVLDEMKSRWAVLALVALGTFMTTLDASIVNISLPSIARTFHTPIGSAVEWVIIGYLIAARWEAARDPTAAGRDARRGPSLRRRRAR